jgi:transcription initiation factor TFIID TATA-box-binding protein
MTTPVGVAGGEYRGLRVVNIVASGELGVGEIDTDLLSEEAEKAEPSLVMTTLPGRIYTKPYEGSPVAMVFRSGSFTIARASTWTDVVSKVQWLCHLLSDIGLQVNASEAEISLTPKYLVVTGDLGERVNLSTAVVGLGMEQSEYEPEQFPALIYRPPNRECTVLIFSTGKFTITGVGDVQTAHSVFKDVESQLSELVS